MYLYSPIAHIAPLIIPSQAAVCLPMYSEEGYALGRGLQSLALQRADLRRYYTHAKKEKEEMLPELHVFVIADGWKQAGA